MKTLSLKSPLLKNYSSVKKAPEQSLSVRIDEALTEKAVNILDLALKKTVPYFFLLAFIYIVLLTVQLLNFISL